MKESTYIPREDADGNDYYCPMPGGGAADEASAADPAECVEKDVTERYSGNFDIAE